MRYLYVLIISFVILSCENKQNRNRLSINMDAVVKENDSIQIYYTTNDSINFKEKQSFWVKIKGNKKNQKIRIIFPDTIRPKQIRLDFGRNVLQKDIVLNEIKFSYQEKSFEAKGEEIYWIFRVDDSNTSVDKLTGNLKRRNPKQINGPSLYPAGNKLFKKLNELYSEN